MHLIAVITDSYVRRVTMPVAPAFGLVPNVPVVAEGKSLLAFHAWLVHASFKIQYNAIAFSF
jgi:hypothetical protein